MVWNVPMTFTSGAPLTAAQLNEQLRDNMNETVPAKATMAGQYPVATDINKIAMRFPMKASYNSGGQSTTGTSYGNLSTVGPSVTVATGGMALIVFSSRIHMSAAGVVGYAAVEVSGATSIAASDQNALFTSTAGSGNYMRASHVYLETGLTPGTNTFTMKYRTESGTCTYQYRDLTVFPY